jgi:hypothetical protein
MDQKAKGKWNKDKYTGKLVKCEVYKQVWVKEIEVLLGGRVLITFPRAGSLPHSASGPCNNMPFPWGGRCPVNGLKFDVSAGLLFHPLAAHHYVVGYSIKFSLLGHPCTIVPPTTTTSFIDMRARVTFDPGRHYE